MELNTLYMAYGTDFTPMTRRLLSAAGLDTALNEKAAELKKPLTALRIGIKPNLVDSIPAEYGATTHPEVVAGIIEYLQALGCSNLIITEGAWVGGSTEDAFEYCGYRALSQRYGVPLKNNKKDTSFRADCAGLELSLCTVVKELDFLINVPVVKGHAQTKVTCALKNLKGLLPDREKRRFHSLGLHKPIAHLNAFLKQDFIVADHICGDPDFEEGGNPLVRNGIIAARDPVLLDAYAARLLGYVPEEIEYILLAAGLGVGSMDLEQLQIIVTEGESTEALPDTRRLLEVRYAVDAVDSCSGCYGNLLQAMLRLKEEGISLPEDLKIGIGQGWQGKPGAFGVGRCTSCFSESVPGCPPTEEAMYEALRRKALQG